VKLAALALALFATLVVGQLEAMDLVASGMMGLVFLSVIIASFGLLVAGWIKRSRLHALRGLALASLFLASVITGGAVQAAQVRTSKLRGDQVCAALKAYRERVGAYPASLSALVPVDLPHVPVTAMGVLRTFEFEYAPRTTDDFDLRFAQPAWTGWRRGSAPEWSWYD
jgi:hypothetical protein